MPEVGLGLRDREGDAERRRGVNGRGCDCGGCGVPDDPVHRVYRPDESVSKRRGPAELRPSEVQSVRHPVSSRGSLIYTTEVLGFSGQSGTRRRKLHPLRSTSLKRK